MSTEVAAQPIAEEPKKVVKKELIPAPAPVNSPWKAAASTGDADAEMHVAELLDASRKRKNKSPQPAMKSSINTKWVPIQVSITVSSNANNSNNNRKSNNSNRKGGRSAPKRTSSFPPQGANNNNSQVKGNAKPTQREHKDQARRPQRTSSTKKVEAQVEGVAAEDKKAEESTPVPAEEQINNQEEQTQTEQQSKPYQNNNRRRFNNSPHQHQNKQFRAGPSSGSSFNSHRQHQNGQQSSGRYNKYSNRGNSSHRPHYNRHYNRPMAKIQQSFYPMQPVMMAINNVARQIEYYFSDENLAKDEYLKSKLSKDGYAPLELIAKFYRLVNMSFGGDANIILAALREIVQNPAATVEVATGAEQIMSEEGVTLSPLSPYFIRAKEFSKWVPETIENNFIAEKTLTEGSLDSFMVQMPTQQERNVEHPSNEEEQTTSQTEEVKDDQTLKESN
ncbi:RNA-binding protein SRO9 [Nakaseomyces bracarensis]|uniref:RNA-binding protein SRO9 n=1 Tax=Nakaseomyces bracarensis TaxID=273131 RepID=A0ABR4NYH7_9SACH